MIIENLLVGDHLETDLFSIKETIEDKGRENILCIMSTTTCFAPRVPDKYVIFVLGITHLELDRKCDRAPTFPEVYSEPCRYLRWVFFKNSQWLSTINYFSKNLHLRCLTGIWICLYLSAGQYLLKVRMLSHCWH